MNQIMTAPRQRLMLVAATSVAVVASILVPMRADAAETRERAEQIVAFEQAMTEQQPDIAPGHDVHRAPEERRQPGGPDDERSAPRL